MRPSYEVLPAVSLQNKISVILLVKAQPIYLHLKNVQGKTISSYTKVTPKHSENKKYIYRRF